MRRRRPHLTAALVAILALAFGVAGARGQGVPPATGVVPAEGEWLGAVNGGFTMGFMVSGGQITKLHFGNNAGGSCGAGEATEENAPFPPQLESDGSWHFTDQLFEIVEGVFVSPERTEGRIVSPGRSFPNCPYTEANFAAELGRVPTDVKPQVLALRRRGAEHPELRPREIRLNRRLYLFPLKWKRFGENVTTATGKANLRVRGRYHEWPVAVRLSHPVLREGGYELYATLSYRLRGPIKPGLPIRRHAVVDML
ncbi:MAG: hypothetical protein QM729_02880 [Solirubrobacterales bacterium]